MELVSDEKDMFLDFASGMLQWLPKKRKPAKELLQHPLFDFFYKDRDRDIEAPLHVAYKRNRWLSGSTKLYKLFILKILQIYTDETASAALIPPRLYLP